MSRCIRPGCRNESKPRGDYCKDACRAAAHKIRAKMADGMLPAERRRLVDRESKKAARAGGVIASDVRLSYARTVHEVAVGLCRESGYDGPIPIHRYGQACARAERLLALALPERLRDRA